MSDTVIFALSDAVSNQAIQLVGTIFTGLMAYFMLRLSQQQKAAAVEVKAVAVEAKAAAAEVKTVKTTLEATTTATDKKLNDISLVGQKNLEQGTKTLEHVNSGALQSARLYAAVTARLAKVTGDDGDIQIAEASAKLLAEKEKENAEMLKRPITAAQMQGVAEVLKEHEADTTKEGDNPTVHTTI